jgi:toxin ParE1/3/4
MAKYQLTAEAGSDLITIHQLVIRQFGMTQADKYFNTFFDYFELIAQRSLALK